MNQLFARDELAARAELQAVLYQHDPRRKVLLGVHSRYVRQMLLRYFELRDLQWNVVVKRSPGRGDELYDLQFLEYEEIDWDTVLAGETRSRASSYCVRKGMTRKAAWAQVVNKWVEKHGKESVLGRFVPDSLVVSTWDAFSDDGGWLAKFGVRDKGLALAEALRDAEEWLNGKDLFILKPSIAKKGDEVTPVRTLQEVKNLVQTWQDCREWVLQRYVPSLLLLDGERKFHLRVFIICVGALKVHLFTEYIGFFASSAFSSDDQFSHITNAAYQRDYEKFDENHAFKLPNELALLAADVLGISEEQAVHEFTNPKGKILQNLSKVIAESFRALKTTPAVFQPHPNCFELFGLDFLVDRDLNTHLLEFNSGPDLEQAKENRLSGMIKRLIHGWFCLGVDEIKEHPEFMICYEDEWAFAQGGTQKVFGDNADQM